MLEGKQAIVHEKTVQNLRHIDQIFTSIQSLYLMCGLEDTVPFMKVRKFREEVRKFLDDQECWEGFLTEDVFDEESLRKKMDERTPCKLSAPANLRLIPDVQCSDQGVPKAVLIVHWDSTDVRPWGLERYSLVIKDEKRSVVSKAARCYNGTIIEVEPNTAYTVYVKAIHRQSKKFNSAPAKASITVDGRALPSIVNEIERLSSALRV